MTPKLICFDMDGVIFKDINFWMELHKTFGTLEQGKILTEKYLHADYAKLVEEVVGKLWKGKDAKPYFELVNAVQYLRGVKETFAYIKKKGYITAIISASSFDVARRAQQDLGIDHIYANQLIIRDGKVSGEFVWPIGVGKEKKARILHNLCTDQGILPKESIYIGDSDTDIEACQKAGISIAFNSHSEKLQKGVTHIVEGEDLSAIIKYIP